MTVSEYFQASRVDNNMQPTGEPNHNAHNRESNGIVFLCDEAACDSWRGGFAVYLNQLLELDGTRERTTNGLHETTQAN